MKQINKFLLILFVGCFTMGCTNLDEESFSKLSSDKFYVDANSVQAALTRPYEHAHWCGWDGDRWLLQELTADHFVWTQKGKHGYDDGLWIRLHTHTWNSEQGQIYGAWVGPYQGIGQCNTLLEDFSKLNFQAFGIDNDTKNLYVAEIRTLRAWFYMFLLDFFREVPIVTDTRSVVAQSTPKQLFTFIETELKESAPLLKDEKTNKGRWSRAAANALLVRLYLNAKVWIGEDKYEECANLAQKIISNEFGNYEIDTDYRGPFRSGIGKFSAENIMEFPHRRNYLEMGWLCEATSHYKMKQALDHDKGGWNGVHLTPSRDMEGKLYSYKLGMPYMKFSSDDYRKQTYKTTSTTGEYDGFFMIGQLYSYNETNKFGYDSTKMVMGSEEWKDLPLLFVDQVGRFSEDPALKKKDNETSEAYTERMKVYLSEVDKRGYYIATDLEVLKKGSQVNSGEENSGVRFLKFPWLSDRLNLFMNNSVPEIRLAEVYYALAECKYRAGKVSDAAILLDAVRKRNYSADKWPNYSYEDNINLLTDDEFVDELGREFIGERKRRTDLIRWNRFGEEWWNKEKDTKDKTVFPIPYRAINANPLLKSNGY